jgi:hypothetical protein
VVRRLIDVIALHLMLSINKLIDGELIKVMYEDLKSSTGGGVKRLREESSSMNGKRQRLERSVTVLKESKETVENIMDTIGVFGDN